MPSPTDLDRAEQHRTQMLSRLSTTLTALKDDLDHDEKEVRHAAGAVRLMLIGAMVADEVTTVQAWTYVRGHVSDCFRDDTRGKAVREFFQRVLLLLDGK